MMGQQQQTVTGSALRRILLALLVAALMAATMALSAMPAMAENVKGPDGGRPLSSGDLSAPQRGAAIFHESRGVEVINPGSKG